MSTLREIPTCGVRRVRGPARRVRRPAGAIGAPMMVLRLEARVLGFLVDLPTKPDAPALPPWLQPAEWQPRLHASRIAPADCPGVSLFPV
jgi:hypothetical protein